MAEKIAAGIIGTGFIGPAHVEAGRRLGNIEFVALAEANAELARSKADLLCIEKSYGDYRELLADPQIRVVHNCTPNHLHYQVNKDILAAGKHVISEKPLAMTAEEAWELVGLARENKKEAAFYVSPVYGIGRIGYHKGTDGGGSDTALFHGWCKSGSRYPNVFSSWAVCLW